MLFAGYFLGGVVEHCPELFGIEGFKLEDHIDKVVIVVVFLSILPMIIELLKAEFGESKLETEIGSEIEIVQASRVLTSHLTSCDVT